jgi:hypothetical protein
MKKREKEYNARLALISSSSTSSFDLDQGELLLLLIGLGFFSFLGRVGVRSLVH